MDLVRIDSPSRHEGQVANFIKKWFKQHVPEATVVEDNSQLDTGSDTGNIIVKVPGEKKAPSLFFNAHMDTVEPGRGIRPIFENGIFRTDGSTVLGGDDKAAIAIMMETVIGIREQKIPHGPLELLFTTCEEIGLLGAKALDPTLMESRAGMALDTEDPNTVINRAPAAIRFELTITGIASHAGLYPEKGISAIKVAAHAIDMAPQGRIDVETTCNIGLIKGGTATNIVPDLVKVQGEVRSHDEAKLKKVQDELIGCFYQSAKKFRKKESDTHPYVSAEVEDDYPLMSVPEEHPIVKTVLSAGSALGRKLELEMTGGGSDANILNNKGLTTIILGIGMHKVHTTDEYIRLDDMKDSCILACEIIRQWSER